MNRLTPVCVAAGSVFAATTTKLQRCPLEMKVFCPFNT